MNFLRTAISPRAIVFLTLLLAWIVRFQGYDAIFGGYVQFLQVLVGILVIGSISIAMSAFSSFDISSKRAFVMDIILDLIFFGAATALLIYLATLGAWGVDISAQAFTLTITALGLSILDFLISLNGGAGKLLEMDREHFTRDR
jgi:hypothetical protein